MASGSEHPHSVFLSPSPFPVNLPKLPFDLGKIKRVTIIACGTSYYAGLVARYWFENIARLPVHIDIASEYRYRNVVTAPDSLAIFVSQSGETADTLAAMRASKAAGQHCMALWFGKAFQRPSIVAFYQRCQLKSEFRAESAHVNAIDL